MDIDRYLADNETNWVALADLTRRARSRPSRLPEADLEPLLELYLRTSADLSFARTHQPEPLLLDRLNRLVAGSRPLMEGRRAPSLSTCWRFFSVRFPTAVWHLRRFVVLSALLTFLPAVAIGLWISHSPAALEAAVPAPLRESFVEREFEEYYSEKPASQFGIEVTLNNIKVSILAFAGGMLAGLGTVAILVFNGANLGFAAGVFAAADQQGRFYGLILPHGMLELTAIVLAGAAGLSLGWSMVAPGDRSRRAAVSAAAGRSLTVIAGLMTAFVVAGLIEAFVTGSTLTTAMRVGLGGSVELSFVGYLYLCGRRGAAAGATSAGWSSDLASWRD